MQATGGLVAAVTTSAALPETPLDAAVICVVPANTPVTRPAELTVATAGLLDVQAIVPRMAGAPLRATPLAVAVTVWPTASDAALSVTLIAASPDAVFEPVTPFAPPSPHASPANPTAPAATRATRAATESTERFRMMTERHSKTDACQARKGRCRRPIRES